MMLLIARKIRDLDFSLLMEVYREGNQEKYCSLWEAEQQFYEFLTQVFFRTRGALYAVWAEKGCYCSALRLEPYQDGLLIEALETAPELRRQGYAGRLLEAVLEELGPENAKPLYSHVARSNGKSLAFHRKYGFRKILDHAVYIDGSVVQTAVTLCRNIKTPAE